MVYNDMKTGLLKIRCKYQLAGQMQRGRIFGFTFFFLIIINCQHAQIELAPALITPEQKHRFESEKQINRGNPAVIFQEKDRIILNQNYYLWGLFPRIRKYNESGLCPSRGIREIHQFSSFTNLIFEQLTLGIYSPRTMEILCY